MEYVYAAMLLHKAGKEINEANVKKVLEAAGLQVDETKVKALVASLDGVYIEKAIKESVVAPVVSSAEAKPAEEEVDEEPKEEEKVEENASLSDVLDLNDKLIVKLKEAVDASMEKLGPANNALIDMQAQIKNMDDGVIGQLVKADNKDTAAVSKIL